ncbi:hypothetical protein A2841_00325 [Candidatus Kaiserbacteria bacterium RIFCSPHIGHO2_01_FULL_48_10]|uniref:Methyltransferase type 11 domain-containing protein n=1 Tax=Candidatus Kaiserbacteria bacterium RIFCSPHIGHO2_01_FULL_48_10 TaxID=1798476 RepID=A0A1F6C189_9BACT|nr:MAG: hypothetical protein A2841_00325 [Candidatus Kaiserbacteria bacterium RIFCSPHIGHO2_01_FULL_48_10]
MTKFQDGLENVYHMHHQQARGDAFLVLGEERGAYLKREIGTGKSVLDIGCRDGALTASYATGNTVLGVDIDSTALARAKERLSIATQQIDLNNDWGLPATSFDAVVAAEILEHLYYPSVVLEKIKSVLKPNGFLVGSIPHAFSLQSRVKLLLGRKDGTPLSDPTHINHFTYHEFRTLLEKNFTDVSCTPLIPARYRPLSLTAPFAFAEGILFRADKPRLK